MNIKEVLRNLIYSSIRKLGDSPKNVIILSLSKPFIPSYLGLAKNEILTKIDKNIKREDKIRMKIKNKREGKK